MLIISEAIRTIGGISARRVAVLCKEGYIPGAQMVGTSWGIPEDAEKPADTRIKSGKYIKVARAETAGEL